MVRLSELFVHSPSPRFSHNTRTNPLTRRGVAALALALSVAHFASFDLFSLPIVTDVRYFLYFAWRVTEGAVPHQDLFDNKTQLATFAGALLYKAGSWLGVDPLYAIRAGYLGIAALGGWLVFFIHRRLGGGSPVAGLLGLLAYCSFGLLGLLPALGNVPKLLTAVLASATGLLVLRCRWFLAGMAGGLAFMDWQVGALVWVAAFASALIAARPRRPAAVRVFLGGAAAVLPFASYYLLQGGLGDALEQTLLASFFRGSSTLARQDLSLRLARIQQVLGWGCPGHEWLVFASLLGIPVAFGWLWRIRRAQEVRLLLPLCIYHFGIVGFALIDFQGYGDLAVTLHSIAFLLAIGWIALYRGARQSLLGSSAGRTQIAFAAWFLALALAVSRPGPLRPDFDLTVANERVDFRLDDQREVAAAVRELTEDRVVLFLNRSELLFLMRRANSLPNIFWNDAVWSQFRLSEAESNLEAAERLVRSVDPDVLVWHWRIGRSRLVERYPERRIESGNGRYAVTLRVRRPGRVR